MGLAKFWVLEQITCQKHLYGNEATDLQGVSTCWWDYYRTVVRGSASPFEWSGSPSPSGHHDSTSTYTQLAARGVLIRNKIATLLHPLYSSDLVQSASIRVLKSIPIAGFSGGPITLGKHASNGVLMSLYVNAQLIWRILDTVTKLSRNLFFRERYRHFWNVFYIRTTHIQI